MIPGRKSNGRTPCIGCAHFKLNIMADKLLEMFLIAVATVLATVIIGGVIKRILRIRLFRYRCDLAFYKTVLSNPAITVKNKEFVNACYEFHKPTFSQLFFSRRKPEISEWFDGEEIDCFFVPAFK